ncbi:MAG: BlaI/MecI/CopY family transcriptional regulator [Fuerstiella sp.]|nr:BlaI/MecI/CopY family transcriptional regulator [Fuerstiella sp.]
MTDHASPIAISPAEWEVMKVLWQHGAMAARDVFAALPEGSEWAYRTVKTLLARLVAKEAIAYDQVGNSYLYRAVADEAVLTRQEVRTVFQRVTRGALSPVLAHFIEEADLSNAEIEQLRKTLDRKQRDRPADADSGESS